jgi:hypothetical protein
LSRLIFRVFFLHAEISEKNVGEFANRFFGGFSLPEMAFCPANVAFPCGQQHLFARDGLDDISFATPSFIQFIVACIIVCSENI